MTGVSGEAPAGGTLIERYEPLCANVPRREKKRHSHASRDCTRDEGGAIQNFYASLVRRALSSIVSCLDDAIAALYVREINCGFETFWDGGIKVWIEVAHNAGYRVHGHSQRAGRGR